MAHSTPRVQACRAPIPAGIVTGHALHTRVPRSLVVLLCHKPKHRHHAGSLWRCKGFFYARHKRSPEMGHPLCRSGSASTPAPVCCRVLRHGLTGLGVGCPACSYACCGVAPAPLPHSSHLACVCSLSIRYISSPAGFCIHTKVAYGFARENKYLGADAF